MSNGDASPTETPVTDGPARMKSESAVPGPLAEGVTLLPRGSDPDVGVHFASSAAGGETFSPASESPASSWRSRTPASAMLPGWIPHALFGSNLVMIAVALLWALAGVGDWRWIGIGALLAVGCVQTLVAWALVRPQEFGAPAQRGAAEAAATPRIRVHFVDETPRHRR